MTSKVKAFTAVLVSMVLLFGCILCAGCTTVSPEPSVDVPETTPKDTSVSTIVGTWVEKINDDTYWVYNLKADGNAEMISYSISTGNTGITQTTWEDLGGRVYKIGNARLTSDANNQWQLSHSSSGINPISKYSSALTAYEHIADAVASVAKKSDSKSEQLKQSISTAIGYLNIDTYSRAGLLKVLQDQNIANSLEAVDQAGINWMNQAELAADKYVPRGANTESRLYAKLSEMGFTAEEVQHGVAYAKEKGLI